MSIYFLRNKIVGLIAIWIILLFCSVYLFGQDSFFRLGVETISKDMITLLRNGKNGPLRIGLVTNQTGKDQKGKRSLDLLLQQGLKIVCVFSPEHGFSGSVKAGNTVHDEIDKSTKVPVYSLYVHGQGRKIDAEKMNNIDLLLYDIQDSGMRHYTYISLLLKVMEAALEYNKKVIVLDRPNPLGSVMEGPLVQKDLISFISIAPIPLRHGMTMGELALYFNTHILSKPIDLEVVPMQGYDRSISAYRVLAPLSPNIKSLDSMYGYSFLGLLGELSPFAVGVGTAYAFQVITLPESLHFSIEKWMDLKQLLGHYGISSSFYSYKPHHKKQRYTGLKLSIKQIDRVPAFELFIALVQFFKKNGVNIVFSSSFDKAAGLYAVRRYLEASDSDIGKTFFADIDRNLHIFYNKVSPLLLYQNHPILFLFNKNHN